MLICNANEEFKKVKMWFDANQLSLNVKKTHYMIFNSKHTVCKNNLIIDDDVLQRVSCTSFLGVKIDDKLTWKQHIDHVNSKLCKSIGILNKVKSIISTHCLLKLYKCLVLPYINYCNIVWGSVSPSTKLKVVTTQKRAIKLALKVPRTTPTSVIFEKSNLKTIDGINRIHTAIFMYKYECGLLPSGFDNKYEKNQDVHNYNTRQAALYHIPKSRTNRFKTGMLCRGPIIWNSLPSNIRQVQPLSLFKSQIKKFFL